MIEHEDDELRASFLELRADDADRAPTFRALTNDAAADRIPQIPRRRWSRARSLTVAAAAILLVLGVAREIGMHTHDERLIELAASSGVFPLITTWQSPTQGLLETSGHELLAPPPVLSSVLGDTPRVPLHRKGD